MLYEVITNEDKVPKPMYDKDDVRLVYQLPRIEAAYDEKISLGKGVNVVFKNAGHILDSAVIQIHFEEEGKNKTVVFSGDLGNHNDLVMPSPDILEEADALFIESTYGDRNHKGVEESDDELQAIIQETLGNNGNA